jgi:curved DNA-binding protein CbpA
MLEGRDQEVAAVAARLRAFVADTRRAGPRYLSGFEPLPNGAIVLRFAQGRVPASLGDADGVRQAAEQFVRRVCLSQDADHYQVLCAARDAPAEAIKENYHLLMSLLHPDRQEAASGLWPADCAQRVNLAYAALGDPEARREYDARARMERVHHVQPDARARRGSGDVRFAKTLIAVSALVAAVVGAGFLVHDDEWSDQSVLEAGFARMRASAGGLARPRYVGANGIEASRGPADVVVGDTPEAFAFFRPLMRSLVGEEPKPFAPEPKIEIPASRPPAAQPAEVERVAMAEPAPLRMAQSTAAPADRAPGTRPGNKEVENLVVMVIAYYEAGDAEKLAGLLDAGFWRTSRTREAYSDFFRATRSRKLRLERLTWSGADGIMKAQGEATIQAEYYDSPAPVERRVDVEMDIALRDGKARLTRLALFPEVR